MCFGVLHCFRSLRVTPSLHTPCSRIFESKGASFRLQGPLTPAFVVWGWGPWRFMVVISGATSMATVFLTHLGGL